MPIDKHAQPSQGFVWANLPLEVRQNIISACVDVLADSVWFFTRHGRNYYARRTLKLFNISYNFAEEALLPISRALDSELKRHPDWRFVRVVYDRDLGDKWKEARCWLLTHMKKVIQKLLDRRRLIARKASGKGHVEANENADGKANETSLSQELAATVTSMIDSPCRIADQPRLGGRPSATLYDSATTRLKSDQPSSSSPIQDDALRTQSAKITSNHDAPKLGHSSPRSAAG